MFNIVPVPAVNFVIQSELSEMRSLVFSLLILVQVISSLKCIAAAGEKKIPPFYSEDASKWADSVLATLTPHERIAQLIMVAAWSNKDSSHIKEIQKQITDWGIGGLIFFQGGPVRQAMLTNNYQRLSKIPLMIGIDGEWGLNMRLDSTIRFPRQMTLSAMQDDSLIYYMGKEIARQCKRLGIHVNFAPDADVNNNPLNPVIGSRSFGDDPEQVFSKSLMYMKGMQDNGVLANGKHFPGHGNADSDSHFTLPVIRQDAQTFRSVELYPFRKLIDEGLGSVMIAHLFVPALDSTKNLPSTLSKPIVSDLLQDEMGFKGLVFTDALNMKAVSTCYKPGVLDKLALLAGNDVLLYSEDVRKAVLEIHSAVDSGEISMDEIDRRAKKVLMAKFWCGLNKKPHIEINNLREDLNSPEGIFLQRKMYEQSLTLLTNKNSLLPLRITDSLRIAVVSIGEKPGNAFHSQLKQYGRFDFFTEEKDAPLSIMDAMYQYLVNYDLVIVSLHGTTMKAQNNYGVTRVSEIFIDSVLNTYKTVFVNFGNAYTLSRFRNLKSAQAVVLAYEDFELPQQLAAQLVMGGISADGRLPVNATKQFKRDTGTDSGSPFRLKYTVPEDAGMSSVKLARIDSIAVKAIKAGAMPGCQVMVVKDRKVVYMKSFGHHDYSKNRVVTNSDLYDVASITKIAGAGLAMMKVYEEEGVDPDKNISNYLPKLRSGNKKNVKIADMLTHQAGFQAWIPFWKKTQTETGLSGSIYNRIRSEKYKVRVADSIYMRNDYVDSVMSWVYNSPVSNPGKYVYSDLGTILVKALVERETGKAFDDFLDEKFYGPLQLQNSAFNPLDKFDRSRIVPTEFDKEFRNQLIHGYVHDPAAAMLGGVSGNAGLFSNANDIAIIMQMLLDEGQYGGIRFLKSKTVKKFTSRYYPESENRRGLLFDKPETNTDKPSPCARSASPSTFGHQGFTGTCAWADPENDLIFVFLSNRIHPDASNDKLIKMNVRTDLHQAVYDAIIQDQFSKSK
ncbi:MAG: hypothetical protein DWQ44_03485 [Bacteroidetes bacterium]|nr:MAG: hypothetical protein DWQ33_04315 [Bacteroidota bacterium]REJ99944.1 MAG: hypothetical protein DWQ39_13590 [Bacteroidota bacterium]REK35876.1 MAG: hypothetical protein DWQ44_03485 [Bacteroidota bacterium]